MSNPNRIRKHSPSTLTVGEVIDSVEKSALAQEYPVLLVVAFIAKNKKGEWKIKRQTIPFDGMPTPAEADKAMESFKSNSTPHVRMWFDCQDYPPRLAERGATTELISRLRGVLREKQGLPPLRVGVDIMKVDGNAARREKRLQARLQKKAAANTAGQYLNSPPQPAEVLAEV